MLRIVSTLLLSGALVLGAVGSASAQSDLPKSGSPSAPTADTGPLAAGPAAGIRQAQAEAGVWNYVPFAVVGGLALLVVLFTGDDDEDDASAPTTTGTN